MNNNWAFQSDHVWISGGLKTHASDGFIGVRSDGNIMLFQNDGAVLNQSFAGNCEAKYSQMGVLVKLKINGQKYSICFDTRAHRGAQNAIGGGILGNIATNALSGGTERSFDDQGALAQTFVNALNYYKTQNSPQIPPPIA